MRFYFQDKAAGNFATKCIRVSSTATTQDVIETLAEKFRPDMRMLSSPKYSLYEVHVSGGLYLSIKSFLCPHHHHIYSQPKYLQVCPQFLNLMRLGFFIPKHVATNCFSGSGFQNLIMHTTPAVYVGFDYDLLNAVIDILLVC